MIELVKNRETREPFIKTDRSFELGSPFVAGFPVFKVAMRAAEKGVNIGPTVPNTLVLLPNCTITNELLDMACDAIDYGLVAVDEMCD